MEVKIDVLQANNFIGSFYFSASSIDHLLNIIYRLSFY